MQQQRPRQPKKGESNSETSDPDCEEVLGRTDAVYFTSIFFSLLFLFKNLQALYSNYMSIFFLFFKNLFFLIGGSLLYNIVVVFAIH